MKRKITDSEGFHIPVKEEKSYAEGLPSYDEQIGGISEELTESSENGENAAQTQRHKPIGTEEIRKATQRLKEYIASKSFYDERYRNNYKFYDLLYTENNMPQEQGSVIMDPRIKRRGAQALNVILNKHADAMDNYPECSCLPRSKDDEETARMLNSVIPCVLQRNGFLKTYSTYCTDKLVGGAGCISCTWDSDADGGLGEVRVRREDILSLFWEPFIENIQESRDLFNVKLYDRDTVKELFPQLKEVSGEDLGLKDYRTFDNKNRSLNKVAVIDWYYKKNGYVHLCKYNGETIIEASENEPEKYPDGYYSDGKYPFIVSALLQLRDTPVGFGFMDVARAPQDYLDELKRDIVKNIKVNSKTRNLRNAAAQVNDEDLTDLDNEMIEVDGVTLDNAIRPLETKDIAAGGLSVYHALIDEIKETTGTNDASNGASAAGVTSGAAISALQEAGGKISRDINKLGFFDFEELCAMMIERMRQFYTPGRYFRITGDNNEVEYKEFDNTSLMAQEISVEGSEDKFERLPIFDIDVRAQRSNPYTTAVNNQMMMDMFRSGMFSPDAADASIIALECMSFEGKEKVLEMVKRNKTLLDAVNELSGKLQMADAMMTAQTASESAPLPVHQPKGATL